MSITGWLRPALTRGVFAIEQEQLALPDPLALDTGFVVEALLATQPLQATCSAFLGSNTSCHHRVLGDRVREEWLAFGLQERALSEVLLLLAVVHACRRAVAVALLSSIRNGVVAANLITRHKPDGGSVTVFW